PYPKKQSTLFSGPDQPEPGHTMWGSSLLTHGSHVLRRTSFISLKIYGIRRKLQKWKTSELKHW
ncbi:MAG TPA: hypothetical protein VF199_05685, partial [Bacillales bacterium]